MSGDPTYVHVCVWDPAHTLKRVQAQRQAVRDGTLAKLVKKHGKGTDALRAALQKAKLTTMDKASDGEIHCPDCNALMECMLVRDGVLDKVEQVKDIVEDFDAAIERTRVARSSS